MNAPQHLPDDIAAVWEEIAPTAPHIPAPMMEAYCGQVARLRDAQRRLAADGSVVLDSKRNPVPHPALAIERAAQAEIRAWGDRFTPSQF